ncbi:cupin [Chryseobacterium sp. T16E-39]|uniref:cupin domain-containing protein n=1 Tax=Chryseobacterium sp. T16E-39 TaxID=2015076 RepID=UPI000B5B25BB|nr:cupin domain-containing protein [Chryseobacterium sp. T16E-39]ASK31194.1 cupin [Chryseobacterium sp. T16E-39]
MKKQYWLFGAKVSVLEHGENTESRFDWIEGNFSVGSQSPLHVHTKYSETFYVLDGEALVVTPGVEKILKSGDSYFIAANTPHAIINTSSDQELKALVVASPSGFAKLIHSAGIEVVDGELTQQKPHDMKLVEELLVEIGDEILGPPGARP